MGIANSEKQTFAPRRRGDKLEPTADPTRVSADRKIKKLSLINTDDTDLNA
jgi:hypothetical protein